MYIYTRQLRSLIYTNCNTSILKKNINNKNRSILYINISSSNNENINKEIEQKNKVSISILYNNQKQDIQNDEFSGSHWKNTKPWIFEIKSIPPNIDNCIPLGPFYQSSFTVPLKYVYKHLEKDIQFSKSYKEFSMY